MGKFSRDCRVNVDSVGEHERINVWLDGTNKFFEHKVLIYLLSCVTRSLEQTLAVPFKRGRISWHRVDLHRKPFVQQSDIAIGNEFGLDLIDAIIVFGMENMVERGQTNVFVRTAVTSNIMLVEQFIVVGRRIAACVDYLGIAHKVIGIGGLAGLGICGVRDVSKEHSAGRDCAAGGNRCRWIAFNQCGWSGYDLGKAIRAGDEVAVKVGCKQRNIMHVHIAELDTEHGFCLQLDVSPCWWAAIDAGKQHARCDRLAVDQLIFTQKYLM